MPIIGPVTSPYVQVAEALETIIEAEFDDKSLVVQHDNIHESLGYEGTVVGVAPEDETPTTGRMIQQEIRVRVKFYDYWVKEIDNHTQVDPRVIAGYAERFRRACYAQHASVTGTELVWFFDVITVTYPNDPTGNKSRFEAVVRAFGQNSGLVETLS